MVIKAWKPLHFHGIRGDDATIIDADGSSNGLVWIGLHTWSGLDQNMAYGGHIDYSVAIKACWEKFLHVWLITTGYVFEAVMGLLQLREYWD